jgi:hypothetical protein
MVSGLISYGLLASVFVVTGLRILVEKPNKPKEIPALRWKKVKADRTKAASPDS